MIVNRGTTHAGSRSVFCFSIFSDEEKISNASCSCKYGIYYDRMLDLEWCIDPHRGSPTLVALILDFAALTAAPIGASGAPKVFTKTIQFCQVRRRFQSCDIEWYFCRRLRKEAGGLSSDQKALSSQDNGENTKVCQSTNFTDYLNAIIVVPVIPSGRAKHPANDSSSRCLGTKASIERTHILTSPSRAQSALAD